MTPRLANETQRAYVERVLATEGRVSTFDVLYGLAYEDGRKCSITRLAAIVWTLRHETPPWDIEESHEDGLAVYRLRSKPSTATVTNLAGWQRGWSCPKCGSAPASQPTVLLGGIGRAWCSKCSAEQMFRAAA